MAMRISDGDKPSACSTDEKHIEDLNSVLEKCSACSESFTKNRLFVCITCENELCCSECTLINHVVSKNHLVKDYKTFMLSENLNELQAGVKLLLEERKAKEERIDEQLKSLMSLYDTNVPKFEKLQKIQENQEEGVENQEKAAERIKEFLTFYLQEMDEINIACDKIHSNFEDYLKRWDDLSVESLQKIVNMEGRPKRKATEQTKNAPAVEKKLENKLMAKKRGRPSIAPKNEISEKKPKIKRAGRPKKN